MEINKDSIVFSTVAAIVFCFFVTGFIVYNSKRSENLSTMFIFFDRNGI